MATPREKLAESLVVLRNQQKKTQSVAIKTSEINRVHRERLEKNGFIKNVTKGWYVISNPNEATGDSTSWYTSFWQFCSRYLNDKYGEDYSVSPEQSLLLHAGSTSIPEQLIIYAYKAPNKCISLLHTTSILELKTSTVQSREVVIKLGIRFLTLPASLIYSSPTIYEKNSLEARVALAQISDASDVLTILLKGGHSVIAGRLVGAFRNNSQYQIADNILKTMRSLDFDVREKDPFTSNPKTELFLRERSPYNNRIRLMWKNYRETVIRKFPATQGISQDVDMYLKNVDEIYVADAYHSLSIENYVVTVELIEKVRSGDWDLMNNEKDRAHRNAMAARGYWQASILVKESIKKVLTGVNCAIVARDDHRNWYRELFAPSVTAGILSASDLAGYRTNQVYITNSRHVPLNKEAVRDAMPILFELLENEVHPGVRAVLGHFIFVFIHPYSDGNGRMGRFLMNLMLASGGYPWTIIPVEERDSYMRALEIASVECDIKPFTELIVRLVDSSIKGNPLIKW